MRHVNPTFRFSGREVAEIAKAWLLTSLAFAIFFLQTDWFALEGITLVHFAVVFIISAVTAGLGFVLHELCHKAAAHHFKVYGEFRSNGTMLVISILFAFMGFLFAAPGAVVLFDRASPRENGLIAAAGPVSNMVLALGFLPLALLFPGSLLGAIGAIGLLVNAILGAFNLIPFLGLDGEKIFAWSKPVYFSLVIAAAAMVVIAYA